MDGPDCDFGEFDELFFDCSDASALGGILWDVYLVEFFAGVLDCGAL